MEQNTEKVVNKVEKKVEKKEVNKPLIYRKERKFVVKNNSITALDFFVKSHPAMFFQPFPPRFVNNVYFDSRNFHNYNDNVVGSSNRIKFRIRWYGEQFGFIEKPVLELKIKRGLAGSKKHYKMAPFTFEPGFSHKNLEDLIQQSNLPNEIRDLLKYQTPTLLNQYHRKYYLSRDHIFRLTLDHKIKYIKIGRHQNSFLQRININNDVVVELKYDVEYDEEANKITASFPFRLSKNSKYVNGMDELDVY
jgi:SPX domain protein involved in polyphosphate accumulation